MSPGQKPAPTTIETLCASRHRVELEQSPYLVDVVGHGHHRDAGLCIPAGEGGVRRARTGEESHRDVRVDTGRQVVRCRRARPWRCRAIAPPCRPSLRRDRRRRCARLRQRTRVAARARADRSHAHDRDVQRVFNADRGRSSSRQPPSCGGTPPLPRTRRIAAITAATPSAINARRMLFTSGASWNRTSDLILIRDAL